VFPHTTLAGAGTQIAAVAKAVVASGCDEVLALGVLHGARRCDADLVKAARAGDAAVLQRLRRVHGPGAQGDENFWAEEFSLDSFSALLETAARIAGKPVPRVHARYPFLVGDKPDDLPGLDELRRMAERGCALVATTDPIHHGIGYGTPPAESFDHDLDLARKWAKAQIEIQFAHLGQTQFPEFQSHAAAVKSDFRDPGPVMATLLEPEFRFNIHDLKLVDYAAIQSVGAPTWVAAALVEVRRPSPSA
jgi:hypothetical protein